MVSFHKSLLKDDLVRLYQVFIFLIKMYTTTTDLTGNEELNISGLGSGTAGRAGIPSRSRRIANAVSN